jgi:hypothetical protein
MKKLAEGVKGLRAWLAVAAVLLLVAGGGSVDCGGIFPIAARSPHDWQ